MYANAYKTIIDVLSENERFEKLIEHLQRNRLVPHINSLKSGTLFAPDNEAFAKYKDEDITKSVLLYHLLPNALTGEDFFHGQLVESLYIRPNLLGSAEAGQRIKITMEGTSSKNPGKVYVNNAEITEKDIMVNNQTFIQAINQVLEPPEILGKSLELRNAELYNMMKDVGLDKVLDQERPFTVFVSSQNILNKFNPIEKTYITSEYGQQDFSLLLHYTVIEGVIYSADFPSGKTDYKSLSGDLLQVSQDKDQGSAVNGIRITQSDVLAANGVIHELGDTVIPPSIVFDTRKYLYGLNATRFVSLIDAHGLNHYLEENNNYTLLVPSNEELDDGDIAEVMIRDWLSYHIINGTWTQDNLINNMLLRTEYKSPRLAGQPQRLAVHIEREKSSNGPPNRSIRFDRSRVLNDTISINNKTIHQISESLSLPGDLLEKLVVDLDLSTFIATLYVSEVVNEIKDAQGITLFVPSNGAFQELGLVAKYLVHPTAKSSLQSVLRYHSVTEILYYEDMVREVHEAETLANSTLRISQDKSGNVTVGRPDGHQFGTVRERDILVENGVVHKLDAVQIPDHVTITNNNLLVGIEANSMLEVLEKAGLMDVIEQKDCTVLAPSDKAFAHIDMDALLQDPDQLARVARLHLIPTTWQQKWMMGGASGEYPTLLSDYDKVLIRGTGNGGFIVEVKDRPETSRAQVTGMGKSSNGGGVLEIDAVLMPVRRGIFGLPWFWSIVLIITSSGIFAGMLAVGGFFGYKIWSRRRLGYRAI
ncbi:hypothetical protein EC973_004817 [Apophysomyces ossiformis]|uniref:FAS1 domain-containing protein n=1 Tax=Apophysomyces ossiformis TaxID=679940 RepID=A0A8H7ELA2_9FUNG|nr:hypothetical protein EC973_004817 [Apophysomyces ossiformis]